jgi:hypothetical protein
VKRSTRKAACSAPSRSRDRSTTGYSPRGKRCQCGSGVSGSARRGARTMPGPKALPSGLGALEGANGSRLALCAGGTASGVELATWSLSTAHRVSGRSRTSTTTTTAKARRRRVVVACAIGGQAGGVRWSGVERRALGWHGEAGPPRGKRRRTVRQIGASRAELPVRGSVGFRIGTVVCSVRSSSVGSSTGLAGSGVLRSNVRGSPSCGRPERGGFIVLASAPELAPSRPG